MFFSPRQTQVAVDQLWSDEEEVTSVSPGENVKIKLKVSASANVDAKNRSLNVNYYPSVGY